ncbi:MAG: thioredoxin-disulfide reductase [Mycoplasmoidaceae bacterium]
MKEKQTIYDCLIIGAGPAGLTAAIYCQRAGMKTAFFEKETPGGKMSKTSIIENYPGFESIKGFEISLKMLNQAINSGSEFIYADVIDIAKKNKTFILTTKEEKQYFAKTVIIATGMKERKLEVPGEEELFNKGISYCAICDGALFKQKDIIVVGGGNSAFEESLYLAEIVKKIYLVHRSENFRAEEAIIKKVKENKRIRIITNTIVESFNGKDCLTSVSLLNTKTNKKNEIKVAGGFIFVGFTPITDFVNEKFVKKEDGFIVTNENMETNIEGLFSIGDVNKKRFRQISTAVSDGTIAALNAKKYLDNE